MNIWKRYTWLLHKVYFRAYLNCARLELPTYMYMMVTNHACIWWSQIMHVYGGHKSCMYMVVTNHVCIWWSQIIYVYSGHKYIL